MHDACSHFTVAWKILRALYDSAVKIPFSTRKHLGHNHLLVHNDCCDRLLLLFTSARTHTLLFENDGLLLFSKQKHFNLRLYFVLLDADEITMDHGRVGPLDCEC